MIIGSHSKKYMEAFNRIGEKFERKLGKILW